MRYLFLPLLLPGVASPCVSSLLLCRTSHCFTLLNFSFAQLLRSVPCNSFALRHCARLGLTFAARCNSVLFRSISFLGIHFYTSKCHAFAFLSNTNHDKALLLQFYLYLYNSKLRFCSTVHFQCKSSRYHTWLCLCLS